MMQDPRDRELPDGLEGLSELALDMRWSASPLASSIWERLDAEAWERTKNPYMILFNAHRDPPKPRKRA